VAVDPKTIGNRVRLLRRSLGLTTTDLAGKMGISQAQISRLETGKQGFRSATLAKVAKVLGVKPIYFWLPETTGSQAKQIREAAAAYGPKVVNPRLPSPLNKAIRSRAFVKMANKLAKAYVSKRSTYTAVSAVIRKSL